MFRTTLSAIAFSALMLGSAQALTIDTFNTDQVVSDASPGGPGLLPTGSNGVTATTVSDAANILGEDRTVSIDQIGPGTTPSTININTGTAGLLTLGNTDAFSVSNITYNGIAGGGLGGGLGVDVTEGGADDRFALFQVSGDFPTDITITVSDGVNFASLMQASAPLGMNVPLLFDYASFIGGPVDFTMIDFINIELATNNAQADLRLDFFGTTTEVAEPGVLAVLGLGLAGLGLMRRRRR
ncbi:MAG: hypothetical protein ACI9JL_002206 [Paracoccaceae bacterium]|jgi:hypothetical protein